MSKDYSEDQLIQKSAADLLENELNKANQWTYIINDEVNMFAKNINEI